MIKLIATDMDGTFLDENGTYDKKRLANVLKKFKEQGIVFTAASGRSLLSLEQLFADFRDQMAFIAENGSAAVLFDRLAYEQHLSREQYLDIIDHLSKSPYMENNEYVLSGKDGAYILSDANPGYIEFITHYY
ncbi:HAD hydrolase family protein, partial [Streptococcus agalactiae]|nr:HAD hydrolase family protein [Streptococcus agalactiae]